MFHVKICGVTTPEDARLVAAAGADAIGFNFVAGSPRRLDPQAARAVVAAVPMGVLRVGVFAGMSADEIRRVVELTGLDAVQLHGHLAGNGPAVDPPELCTLLAGLPVIRAVRLGADGLAEARQWIAAARGHGIAPAMALVDAAPAPGAAAGSLGGTGAVVDWQAFMAAGPLDLPVALAGGLAPENVATAIRATGVAAVDVASGVESAPGRKDPEKVRAFVAAAHGAGLGGG
ncbi:MAG: phosphoribosylanthranilate isomerase [Planctomycetota bacterium]|nr:MAG: phosphoribosylanthranilate isomerase [Planctomycetota bacterium]